MNPSRPPLSRHEVRLVQAWSVEQARLAYGWMRDDAEKPSPEVWLAALTNVLWRTYQHRCFAALDLLMTRDPLPFGAALAVVAEGVRTGTVPTPDPATIELLELLVCEMRELGIEALYALAISLGRR